MKTPSVHATREIIFVGKTGLRPCLAKLDKTGIVFVDQATITQSMRTFCVQLLNFVYETPTTIYLSVTASKSVHLTCKTNETVFMVSLGAVCEATVVDWANTICVIDVETIKFLLQMVAIAKSMEHPIMAAGDLCLYLTRMAKQVKVVPDLSTVDVTSDELILGDLQHTLLTDLVIAFSGVASGLAPISEGSFSFHYLREED